MPLSTYNRALVVGLLLVALGAGCVYWPAGLIIGGALLIGLTLRVADRAGIYDDAGNQADAAIDRARHRAGHGSAGGNVGEGSP